MNRYAIINTETNIVDNVIVIDTVFMYPLPNMLLLLLNENEICGPMFKYTPNNPNRFEPPEELPA
jgi:hypothetical protein